MTDRIPNQNLAELALAEVERSSPVTSAGVVAAVFGLKSGDVEFYDAYQRTVHSLERLRKAGRVLKSKDPHCGRITWSRVLKGDSSQ